MWAAVVAGVVVFVALPVLAVLGFVAIMDPGLPSEERATAMVGGAPAGTVVVAEDEGCASAECWRTVTLAAGRWGCVDVLAGMGCAGRGGAVRDHQLVELAADLRGRPDQHEHR